MYWVVKVSPSNSLFFEKLQNGQQYLNHIVSKYILDYDISIQIPKILGIIPMKMYMRNEKYYNLAMIPHSDDEFLMVAHGL